MVLFPFWQPEFCFSKPVCVCVRACYTLGCRFMSILAKKTNIWTATNAKMNAEEFNDYDDDYYNCHFDYYNDGNATFTGNRSGVDCIGQHWNESTRIDAMSDVIFYVILTLGLPGNILSAIVWLRRHVSTRNSSAIYLAALAINDIVYLLRLVVRHCVPPGTHQLGWVWRGLGESARILEPLLVLSLSVERLFAILHPLKVCLSVCLLLLLFFSCLLCPF